MPSSVIAIGVRAVNKRDRQQITPLTCVVLASKDTVGILCILSIHAIDISSKRERKGGNGEEKGEEVGMGGEAREGREGRQRKKEREND